MPPKLHQLQNVIAHEGIINTMALGQRTGKVFATGGDDRFLFLWSVGSNNPRASFGPFQSPITACHFSNDEEKILCGNNSGTVMLFDLNENRCASNWTAHRSTVNGLTFHPSNEKLVLSCGDDGKMHVLSTQQRRPLQSYTTHKGPIHHVSCSPDGRYAATCGDDMTVRVFDLTAQRQLVKLDGHTEAVTCVEFHATEPLLMSCGVDRSIRFWDLVGHKEIPVSFPLDSSPVERVKFLATEAFSLSPDYLKVVGWNPPEFFDHFILGLEQVHDIAFADNMITIASSSGDHALIHRMRADMLKPFSSRSTGQAAVFREPETKPSRPVTPRLLDISAMKKAESSSRRAREAPPPEPPSASSGSSRHVPTKRPGSTDSQPLSEECKIFREFRKTRAGFMSSMNEKFSRLTRISDSLDQVGLTKTLAGVAETGELGSEMLMILRMKPEVVKLEHASLVIETAAKVFDRDHDLAIATVESMLQAFGKLVHATRAMASQGVGADMALEDRKKKCELFVEAFREIAPRLRTVAAGQSTSSQTAAELLEEWKAFLR